MKRPLPRTSIVTVAVVFYCSSNRLRAAVFLRVTKRTVLADIHAGRFNAEYHKRAGNQITVSASGVNEWRA